MVERDGNTQLHFDLLFSFNGAPMWRQDLRHDLSAPYRLPQLPKHISHIVN